jgi:ATP phosphoribosyltransferase regulatory subunit
VRVSAELPVGVAALFGDEARRRRELEERLARELAASDYQEVILPILDFADPYGPLLPPSSRGELYRFSDRDGELLTLRADFTPMLARLLATRLEAFELPARLFYRGDVVRYQENRVGRHRELFQLGAELLGAPGPAAEAEALGLFLRLLAGVAGSRPRVVLGLAGALDELLLACPEPVELARAIARRERSVARRAGRALLEVVEEGVPRNPAALGRCAPRLEALEALRERLAAEAPGIGLTVDLAEFAQVSRDPALEAGAGARAYYDGVVFRAYVGPAAVPVGGGGRYDRLFRELGAPVAAVGFSLGLDRLLFANGGGGRADGARRTAPVSGATQEAPR